MKSLAVFILLLINCFHGFLQNKVLHSADADSVLFNVAKRLGSLKNISYTNTRELNYSSENYRNVSNWNVYYDFETTDTMVGCKYQIEDSTLKQVFNGTEAFDLDKKAKTIQVDYSPDKKSFAALSALYNSLLTVKNAIPWLISDKEATKNITDTNINTVSYYTISINLGKRRIQNLGYGFDAMTTKSNFIYQFIVDKVNDIPVAVLQKNDLNNDFIKTNFNNITVNTHPLAETLWYYSTYESDYKPATEVVVPKLLPVGSRAPSWKLTTYNDDKTINLSDLKGKVVLIDFWIKNCGPCIQSVPHLNELQNKFAGEDFKIVSINSYDPKNDVRWFCNKHQTKYPVLLNGKSVVEQYGVSAFPTFFVIDKTGRVIYSNVGYDQSIQSRLEQVIQDAL